VLEQRRHNRTTLARAAAVLPIQRDLLPESPVAPNTSQIAETEDVVAPPSAATSHKEKSGESEGRATMSNLEYGKQAGSYLQAARRLLQAHVTSPATRTSSPAGTLTKESAQVRTPSADTDNKDRTREQGLFQSWWHQLRQHGLLGSVYRQGEAVQPSIPLVIMVVVFIAFQIIALAFVASHAHSSLVMLRAARHENTDMRASRLRELIPGISWNECVPYDARGPWSSSQNLHSKCPRRSTEPSVHGDEGVFGQMAVSGWSVWFSKQRSQYLKTAGQAPSDAIPQSKVMYGRHSAAPPWGTTPAKDSTHKLQTPRGSTSPDSGKEPEVKKNPSSNPASATPRRHETSKHIMDMLHQYPTPASFDEMLEREYDAMVQWDIESNLSPGLTRRDSRSPKMHFSPPPIAC